MPENYDEFNRQDDFDAPDDSRGIIERAKSAVMVPAILLIIMGIFGLLGGIYNLVTLSQFDTAWDNAMKQQAEQQKNMNAQKKQEFDDTMKSVKGIAKVAVLGSGTLGILAALVMTLGGFRMMALKGRGLAYTSCILAMIPMVSCCCFFGFIPGIWGIMALGKPEVRRGFELVARKS